MLKARLLPVTYVYVLLTGPIGIIALRENPLKLAVGTETDFQNDNCAYQICH